MTRDDRLRRVRAMMEEAGVTTLVAASSGLSHIDQANPVAHLTGFRSLGPSFAIVGSDGGVAVVASPAGDGERLRRRLVAGTEAIATDKPAEAVAARIAGRRRVGTVGFDALPHAQARHVLGLSGIDLVPLDAPFAAATGPKTDGEIAAARRATVIAEDAYEQLGTIARPGMRECDLAIALNLSMKQAGANDSFLMLNAGPRADAVMPSSERRLERGDLILIELSPSVDGQFVQICRTSVVGVPSPVLEEKYALLAAAMNKGIAEARPGAPMGGVCAAIDDHLSAAGYADYSRPPFIRRRGHGLGAGSSFPGDVAVDNPTVLAEGMLFMVHPNQFLPETGYLMCGEPILLGPDGPEVLTRRPPGIGVAGA